MSSKLGGLMSSKAHFLSLVWPRILHWRYYRRHVTRDLWSRRLGVSLGDPPRDPLGDLLGDVLVDV
jgi:hypothetical protein